MHRVGLTIAPSIAITVTLGLVSVGGCRDHGADSSSAASGSGAQHAAAPTQAPPHDGLAVINPGTAPLRLLRYHLNKGDRTASELVWDFATQDDGKAEVTPSLILDFETTVEDVRADGSAQLALRITKTTIRGQDDGKAAGSASEMGNTPGTATSSDLVRNFAASMQGVTIHEVLAPDGGVADLKVDTPPGLAPALASRLDSLSRGLAQITMKLPTEPVGLTASWRERKTLPDGGIRAVSEATYTLTQLTETSIGYVASATMTGPPHTVEQEGVKVEITDTHGQSEVRGTVDLAHYAPQGSLKSSFATTMNIAAPAGTPGAGKSTMAVSMAFQLTPIAVSATPPADAGSP